MNKAACMCHVGCGMCHVRYVNPRDNDANYSETHFTLLCFLHCGVKFCSDKLSGFGFTTPNKKVLNIYNTIKFFQLAHKTQ